MCRKCYELWRSEDRPEKQRRYSYPSLEDLSAAASYYSSVKELADYFQIPYDLFRHHYPKNSPEKAVLESLRRPLLTPEEREQNSALSKKKWLDRNQGTKEFRERKREINRKWAKNQPPENRHKWNAYNRKRRKGVAVKLSEDSVYYAGLVKNDPCSYCNKTGGTVDHVEPIASGGSLEWENLTGACHSCNASKNDSSLLRYLLREAVLSDGGQNGC